MYARNARFFESDEESATKILEGHGDGTPNSEFGGASTGKMAPAAEGERARKLQAPSAVGVPGLIAVTGPPLAAPGEGSLAVVFFFATWCATCEKVLPAILSVAARYSEDGEREGAGRKGSKEGLSCWIGDRWSSTWAVEIGRTALHVAAFSPHQRRLAAAYGAQQQCPGGMRPITGLGDVLLWAGDVWSGMAAEWMNTSLLSSLRCSH